MADIQSSLVATLQDLVAKEIKKQQPSVDDKIRILVDATTPIPILIEEISF